MNRGNICVKAEKKWCQTYEKNFITDLTGTEKEQFNKWMQKTGTRHYNKCVDIDQVKKKCGRISRRALNPYKKARYLKRQYHSIMQLNDIERYHPPIQDQSEE